MTALISPRMLSEAYASYVRGESLRAVAQTLYVSHMTLKRRFVEAGYPYPIRRATYPRKPQRNVALIRDYENGIRGKALVEKYGISKQRILTIVKSQGRNPQRAG